MNSRHVQVWFRTANVKSNRLQHGRKFIICAPADGCIRFAKIVIRVYAMVDLFYKSVRRFGVCDQIEIELFSFIYNFRIIVFEYGQSVRMLSQASQIISTANSVIRTNIYINLYSDFS